MEDNGCLSSNFFLTTMGCNVYLKKKVTSKMIAEIKSLVSEESIKDGTLVDEIEKLNEKIHICKISGGWQVLFDHNNHKFYEMNRKSLGDFITKQIESGEWELIDEYGNQETLENLWGYVESHKDMWYDKTYEEFARNEWEDYCNNPKKYEDRLFKPHSPRTTRYVDPDILTEDGLRFASFTDFS